MNTQANVRSMIMNAVMTAIILIMSFVPFLGYIPLGFMNATIVHVPVIVGAILLGPKSGAWLGFVFGCTSLWKNTTEPNLTSFVFSPLIGIPGVESRGVMSSFGSLAVCFIPRILIGIVSYYTYTGLKKISGRRNKEREAGKQADKRKKYPLAAAGVAGSLTNTILVMNMIYFFFGSSYAEVSKKAVKGLYQVILGVIFMNGIPEAVIAGILTVGIGSVLMRMK